MKPARITKSLVQSVRFLRPRYPTSLAWQPPSKQESLRSFTSSTESSTESASVAAPEIQFPTAHDADNPRLPEGRLVPTSGAYFSGTPQFVDDFLALDSLRRKYIALPRVKPNQATRIVWRTLSEYRNMYGERVDGAKYKKLLQALQELNHIHPSVKPAKVTEVLESYRRDLDPTLNTPKPIILDRFGRALAVGRRKSSTARAWVVQGTGEILINGKSLAESFARVHDRESAIWALKATERVGKYNVWALVEGGGTTGQAEALTLAVAKALLAHEPLLKPALRRAGCVTRDPRRVERKKPGHLKARKMPAWVRR